MVNLSRQAETIRAFLIEILTCYPAKLPLLLCLLALLALSEGAGLFLLGPLLLSLSSQNAGVQGGPILQFMANFAGDFGTAAVLALFFAVIAARIAFEFAAVRLSVGMRTDYLHQCRIAIYEAVRRARWSFLSSRRTSDIAFAMTHQALELSFAFDILVRAAVAAAVFAAGAVLAMLISPLFAAVTILATIAIAIPMFAFEWRAFRVGKSEVRRLSEVFAEIENRTTDLKLLKFLEPDGRTDAEEAGNLPALSLDHAGLLNRLNLSHENARILHQLCGIILLAGLIALFLLNGAPLAEVVLFVMVFARILPRAQHVHAYTRRLIELAPVHAEYRALLTDCRNNAEAVSAENDPVPLPFSRIEFREVSFRYPARADHKVLDGFNLALQAGSTLAVIGLSGAGKTTFVDLLAGLLRPGSGEILVDGVALREAGFEHWRRRVALVGQTVQVQTGTIRQNIELGAGNLSEARLSEAVAATGLDSFIATLPDGLDTDIGRSGQMISRGQRQRIALARAISRKPELLILDEATSALNPVDEAAIIETLAGIGCTVVVVAHRPGSISWVENVAVIDDGRVAAYGSYSELAHRQGTLLRQMLAETDHGIAIQSRHHG